ALGAVLAPAASAMTWSPAVPVARAAPLTDHGVPAGVSCPSSRLCVGVDTFGNVFSSTAPGTGPWALAKVLRGRLTVVGEETSTRAFTGISCPSRTACVASDNHGDLVTSRNPTGDVSAWRILRPAALRRTHADVIACPTAGLCLAGLNNGRLALSTRPLGGPGTWKRSRLVLRGLAPSAISCPSRRLCVIGGFHGTYAVSLNRRGRVVSARRQRNSKRG